MYFSATRKFAAARSPAAIASLTIVGGLRLRLGEALARLGVAQGRLLAALRREDLRLLLALGPQDRRLPQALGLEHGGALLALGLHLPRHGAGEVDRRHDVLDLDAGDLHAPGRSRGIEDPQQALVDLVAMREELVEIHRADHGADVRHGQGRGSACSRFETS